MENNNFYENDNMNVNTENANTEVTDTESTNTESTNTESTSGTYTSGTYTENVQTPYYRSTGNNTTGNTYGNPYSRPTPPVKEKKKKKGFGTTIAKTVAVALIFGLVGGTVFTGVSFAGNKLLGISSVSDNSGKTDSTSSANLITDESADAQTTQSTQSGTSGNTAQVTQTSTGQAKDLTDVSAIVSEVMPSIVAITNTSTINYRDFWSGGVQSKESESCGSGIIISQDDKYLYIATNNHVVSGADTLTVQFADSKVVEAELQGSVASNDLAVVKVALSNIESDTLSAIKVATIGDSDALSVGEAAIAIGNALGYGQSVTTGIVSALGRSVSTQDETTGTVITNDNLIQTDAAINPGNSGGALLNSKGEVIGINSVKYSSTEVEGIGYAIAMADAYPILQKLIENGSYVDEQTAYLGIQGGDVSENMIAYNFPAGVYVASVASNSGAQKAGLQEGDIITAIDGNEVSGMSELQNYLKKYQAGDKVTLTIARQKGNGYVTGNLEVTLSSKADLQ